MRHAYLEKVFNRTYDHSAQETEIRLIGIKSVYSAEPSGCNQDAEPLWVQFSTSIDVAGVKLSRHRAIRHRVRLAIRITDPQWLTT